MPEIWNWSPSFDRSANLAAGEENAPLIKVSIDRKFLKTGSLSSLSKLIASGRNFAAESKTWRCSLNTRCRSLKVQSTAKCHPKRHSQMEQGMVIFFEVTSHPKAIINWKGEEASRDIDLKTPAPFKKAQKIADSAIVEAPALTTHPLWEPPVEEKYDHTHLSYRTQHKTQLCDFGHSPISVGFFTKF